jgi:hypothetical protein
MESHLISRYKELNLQQRIAGVEISELAVKAYCDGHRETRGAPPERVCVAVLWSDALGQAERLVRCGPRLEAARKQAEARLPAKALRGR